MLTTKGRRDLASLLKMSAHSKGLEAAAHKKLVELRTSAVEEVRWLRLLVENMVEFGRCPYCGEDDYGNVDLEDAVEPCVSCVGFAECRQGEGVAGILGCPVCLGCDDVRQNRLPPFDER